MAESVLFRSDMLGRFARLSSLSALVCALASMAVACSDSDASSNNPPAANSVDRPNEPGAKTTPPSTAESTGAIDLGEVNPGDELRVDIPADALGFNISVRGDPDSFVGVPSLTSPSGSATVERFFPQGSDTAGAIGSRGLGSISVPQTNDTATRPLETGAWKLVVGGIIPDASKPTDKTAKSTPEGAPVTSKLRVIVNVQRSGDGAFHGGVLDLHVYIPAGLEVQDPEAVHAITGESAGSDACISRRIDSFYSSLERLFGIGRGTVTFHGLDARFLSARTGEERATLMAQANVNAGQALHVVLTNHLSYTDGPPLLGYSVGLPGAANSSSTVRSSIAVALYSEGSAENDAVTILHEMGHFVGLMHSNDYDGTPDLLSDTPSCEGQKTCGDTNNLMAPDGPLRIAEMEVSASQVRVVRGSPIYRAAKAGGGAK